MTIKALVQEDKVTTYTPKGQSEPRTVRTLNCFDMDNSQRMPKPFRMSIPVSCPIGGDAKGGASLRDSLITASISGIRIFEWDQGLGFEGQLVGIDGRMQVVPDKKG